MRKSKSIFFLFLLVINLVLAFFLELDLSLAQILKTHSFLGLLFFSTSIIQTRLSQNKKPLPTLSLAINLLRIIGCVVFLLPHIFNHKKNGDLNGDTYIYNFFLAYFSLLFFDVFLKWKKTRKINA